MAIGSTRTKSTGFSDRPVKYSDEENNNTDPGNPHPMNPSQPKQNYGSMGSAREYREVPSAGIEKMGVGNMTCNDAACEKVDTKHPNAADLRDAGTLGTARVMR